MNIMSADQAARAAKAAKWEAACAAVRSRHLDNAFDAVLACACQPHDAVIGFNGLLEHEFTNHSSHAACDRWAQERRDGTIAVWSRYGLASWLGCDPRAATNEQLREAASWLLDNALLIYDREVEYCGGRIYV